MIISTILQIFYYTTGLVTADVKLMNATRETKRWAIKQMRSRKFSKRSTEARNKMINKPFPPTPWGKPTKVGRYEENNIRRSEQSRTTVFPRHPVQSFEFPTS